MRTNNGDGGPAFPSVNDVRFGDVATNGHSGMPLRDWLAGQALAGGLEQGARNDMDSGYWYSPSAIAKRAYAIADAMLEARGAK